MKIYSLKSVARRGSMLAAAVVVAGATLLPFASVSADALNPLTERSLTLSSGSPGWSYTDGSGNATYAPPNSGANGQKTGNTFAFRVSSTEELRAFTFQYCTTSAGKCQGPGNNTGNGGTREANSAVPAGQQRSDLEIVAPSASEVDVDDYPTLFDTMSGQPQDALNVPNRNGNDGTFIVLHRSSSAAPWVQSAGWEMTASKVQDAAVDTNKNNFITLANEDEDAGLELTAGDYVKIIFFGTDANYITNPGNDAFFVKINTYKDDAATQLVDGGVTVANVMNRSIEIQTKVLETMEFSVGTVDPNTLDSTAEEGETSEFELATGKKKHITCSPIVTGMEAGVTPNVLKLGNEVGEFSLATDTTYSTHSYWRLSSNSSAGATVYYSGVTLSNTVGDQIDEAHNGDGIAEAPAPGAEQFGLAMDNGTDITPTSKYLVSYATERAQADPEDEDSPWLLYENGADNGKNGIHTASLDADNVTGNLSWHEPQLAPLKPLSNYNKGTGVINSDFGSINTLFAFDKESNLVPTPFAEGSEVVDCVTGKMRYIANIAATTPAGIYTTKINYIAAPKY